MKKLVLIFLMVFAIKANATVRTVSNRADGGAQFTGLQQAIDASQNRDTIYIHGSPDNYGSVTIAEKALTIIGHGFFPDKDNAQIAEITNITFLNDTAIPGDNNGSEVQGVHVNVIYLNSNALYSNIRMLRNYVNYVYMSSSAASGKYTDILFEGNFFTGGIGGYSQNGGYVNIAIRNNVFAQGANISGLVNTSNVIVDHNLFYGSAKFQAFIGFCRDLLISNNIFHKRAFANNNVFFSTFTNNITFECDGTNEPWNSYNNIDGGGNIANQNPSVSSETDMNAGKVTPNLNFTVTGGVAKNAGSDGKDLGLLFDATGSLNWNAGRSARLPIVTKMTISNPVLAPGQNLNVQVTAKKNN